MTPPVLAIRPLSSELAAVARDEVNETSDKQIRMDLDTLKKWLAKQTFIRARTDDQFLIAFLRGCKYSIERAKEKLDNYYSVRTTIPEFYKSRDPLDVTTHAVLDQGLVLPPPFTDGPGGSCLFLVKQGDYDPNELSIIDVMRVSYMMCDILLWEDDNSVVTGQTIIVDLKGLSFSHLAQVSPVLLKKVTTNIQDAYPIRQKGIHFINPTPGFDRFFKIFYNFMSAELKERIFVHSTFADLHNHVPKRLLPNEYNGDAGPIKIIAEAWKQKVNMKRDWFIDDLTYRTNESQRPGKPKGDSDFGTDGTFRRLEID